MNSIQPNTQRRSDKPERSGTQGPIDMPAVLPMGWRVLAVCLGILIIGGLGCKKSGGDNNAAALVGRWRYTNSTTDSLVNGKWAPPVTAYDQTFVEDLADSLQFTAKDTVYYSYLTITTWSNYKVAGNQLILIGSSANDTLIIHSLNTSQLQIGTQNANATYWANYSKF